MKIREVYRLNFILVNNSKSRTASLFLVESKELQLNKLDNTILTMELHDFSKCQIFMEKCRKYKTK